MAYMNWGSSFWDGAQKGYDFTDKAEEAFATRQISKAIEEQEKKRQEELDLINGRLYYDRETGQLMKVPYQGAGPQAPQAPQTAGDATQASPQQAINPNSMVVDVNGTAPRHQLTPSERQQYQEQLNRDYDAAIRQKYAQYGRADQAATFLQNRRGDDEGQLKHQAMQRAQTIIDAWKPDDKGNFEMLNNPETREQALALMNGAKDMLSYVVPGLNKDAEIVYRNGKLGVMSKGKFKPMNAGAARMCMAMGAGLSAYSATGDPSLLSGGFAIGKEMAEGVERQDRMAVMKAKAGVRTVDEGGGNGSQAIQTGGSGDKKKEEKKEPPQKPVSPQEKAAKQAAVERAKQLRPQNGENPVAAVASGAVGGASGYFNRTAQAPMSQYSDFTPGGVDLRSYPQVPKSEPQQAINTGNKTSPKGETQERNTGRDKNKASLSTGKKAALDAGKDLKQKKKRQ